MGNVCSMGHVCGTNMVAPLVPGCGSWPVQLYKFIVMICLAYAMHVSGLVYV